MVLAWTALFHATFLRRHKKPYYRKKNSRIFEKIEGEYKAWELKECLKEYYGNENPPEKKIWIFLLDCAISLNTDHSRN